MIKTIKEVVAFLDSELKVHEDIAKEMHAKGDHSVDEYRRGLMGAYIAIRYEITGENR